MSQTWEARCSVCNELRWPYTVVKPGPDFKCMRCRAVSPEKRAARVAQAVRARKTRVVRFRDRGDRAK